MNKEMQNVINRGFLKFERIWGHCPQYLFLDDNQFNYLVDARNKYVPQGVLLWNAIVHSKDFFEEFSSSNSKRGASLNKYIYDSDSSELLFVSVVEPIGLFLKAELDYEILEKPYISREDLVIKSEFMDELTSHLKEFKHPLVLITMRSRKRFKDAYIVYIRFTGRYKDRSSIEDYKKLVMDFCRQFKAENECMSLNGQSSGL